MENIRKKTGKAARDYEKELGSRNVLLGINPISNALAEVRLKLLLSLGIEKLRYFHERHRYIPSERRLLDLHFITLNSGDSILESAELSHADKIRFRYLLFRYRAEYKQTIEWIRVTDRKEKNQVFVWHEDIGLYEQKKKSTNLSSIKDYP